MTDKIKEFEKLSNEAEKAYNKTIEYLQEIQKFEK